MNTAGAVSLDTAHAERTRDGGFIAADLTAELADQVQARFTAETVLGEDTSQPQGIVVQLDRALLERQIETFAAVEQIRADNVDYDETRGQGVSAAKIQAKKHVPPPASIKLPDGDDVYDRQRTIANREDRRRARRDARRGQR